VCGSRQKAQGRQNNDFNGQHCQIRIPQFVFDAHHGLRTLLRRSGNVQRLRRGDPQKKAHNGEQMRQGLPYIAGYDIHTQQHDVTGHGIRKHMSMTVGESIQETSGACQNGALSQAG
jgi:hypothetical protein